jgi:hypothetical protein
MSVIKWFIEGGLWGLFSKSGIVVEPQYDDIGQFQNGLAQVSIGNKIGYINQDGKCIWAPME